MPAPVNLLSLVNHNRVNKLIEQRFGEFPDLGMLAVSCDNKKASGDNSSGFAVVYSVVGRLVLAKDQF
jgi:hypothetical protein